MREKKVIFEKGDQGRSGHYVNTAGCGFSEVSALIPADLLRGDLPLPDLGELEVVRHYTNLARLNFCVDTNLYPLGSCTMKYNPKVNEKAACLDGFTHIHPYQPVASVQGALGLLYHLQELLCVITGMKQFTFQPASGAQGELAGMLMIRSFHQRNGNKRKTVIVPDSAHGTNPATVSMCGYTTIVVESTPEGLIDVDKLAQRMDENVAAVMLTNPNTLGVFEEKIVEIADIVHAQGGLLYYDGANLNPLLGITTPALMGFDVVHLNLHKTFSTPHGCGGPGAGAVGVSEKLIDFLPVPLIVKEGNSFIFDYNRPESIGRVRSFYGNFGVLVRAYAYLLRLGREGLLRVAHNAVVNANYLRQQLKNTFALASDKRCMHEVVFSCAQQKKRGASALDIAKRLLDYGIHAPTMYFPLIVKEALMAEPTETESKETLDYLIATLQAIDAQIDNDLEMVTSAPHTTSVKRVDEVRAARFPNLRWRPQT